MRKVHFIGIGGVGMNGLAQLAVHSGWQVTGSDRAYHPDAAPFRQLESLGIRFFPQDGSGISSETDQVVFSTAIESGNEDLCAAETLQIPQLHRADFLSLLIGNAPLIAVAGTAGKTTTTGILGWIFDSLHEDPSVYNGAAVLNWRSPSTLGNVRAGSSKCWIIEADESDRSFLVFRPTHSIITNVSKDHFELDELRRMFDRFRDQTSGYVIEGPPAHLVSGRSGSFMYDGVEFEVPLIGRHNLENAWCAVHLCAVLGMDMARVRSALRRFKGIERRLEQVGTVRGITIIDDYAHNPAKISAALASVSDLYPAVHAYWRPHGYTPLAQNFDELVDVLTRHFTQNRGTLHILPVYYAGGSVDRSVTSDDLVQHLTRAAIPIKAVSDYTSLKKELEIQAQCGDAVLGMGARDPDLPLFAHQLVEQWKKS